jgi:hypothetical protein
MEIIGLGDRIAAPFKRAGKRWKGAKRTAKNKLAGQSRTRLPDRVRTTRMGSETVRMTPAMRKALPANQPRARGASTAKRPVRCTTCQGFYGALKSGGIRAHKDMRTGRDCPGGGASKTSRKKA